MHKNLTLTSNECIYFDQEIIIKQLQPRHVELKNIAQKFGGLCELICNFVLQRGILEKVANMTRVDDVDHLDYLVEHISLTDIDQPKIKKSHLLLVYSAFHKMQAFLFGIYPDNIFSCVDQWKLVKKMGQHRVVNEKLLKQGLNKLKVGKTLKFEVFCKTLKGLSGHSMLIKKTSNDCYIFFDPNRGVERNLTLSQLNDKVNWALSKYDGTDLFLTKSSDFLLRLKN